MSLGELESNNGVGKKGTQQVMLEPRQEQGMEEEVLQQVIVASSQHVDTPGSSENVPSS